MGSKTEQKTTIPPPTEEEKALMQLVTDSVLPAYMDAAGFEVNKQTVNWEDTPEGQRFAKRRGELTDQANNGDKQAQIDLQNLNAKEQQERANYTPKVGYVSRKKGGAESEAIREKYGPDSAEYKAAVAKEQEQNIKKGAAQADIEQKILEKTQKFLNGDFSLNDGEKQFIREAAAPIRQSFDTAAKYITDEAAKSKQSIGEAIGQFKDEVEKTGLSLENGIGLIEDRVKQTGVSLKQALDDEIKISQDLIKMGLEDFSRDQRISISNQASALGRSPTDPEFQKELQANVQREIQRSQLELGQYAAEKRLGIEERTGAGLEQAAQQRLGVAERTGQGREQAAQAGIGLAERTASANEQAAGLRAQGETTAGQTESGLRQQLSLGISPQQIGTGIDVEGYQNALTQQRIANLGAAINAPLGIYGTQAQERYRQPTTTTRKSGGIGSFIGGLIGTGLSGAATYFSGGFGGFGFGKKLGGGGGIGGYAGGQLGRDF